MRKRCSALAHRFEALYLAADDDGFLALATAHPEALDDADTAPLGAEAADRLLRQTLGRGDLDQLETLLPQLEPWGLRQPLGTLATAVRHIAAGRLAAAQALLTSFEAEGDHGLPVATLPTLHALAEAKPNVGAENEVVAFHHLRTRLAVLCAPEKSLPRTSGLGPPWADALWSFVRALSRFARRGDQPSRANLAEIDTAAAAMRAALPDDERLERLLAETDVYLGLLRDVMKADRQQQDRRRRDTAPGDAIERLLRTLPQGLTTCLERVDPPPTLLAPLVQGTELLWHRLLTRVAAQEGETRLVALYAAWPRTLAPWVRFAAGSEEDLVRHQASLALQTLLRDGRYQELAQELARQSKQEHAPDRLAVLWSLELCCRRRAAALEEMPYLDELEDEHRDDAARFTLNRLQPMAAAITRRFPAAQRAPVARYLRATFLDLCASVFFGVTVQAVAERLLDHLPDDPELLLAALAGAVCSHDGPAHQRITTRIAAGNKLLDLDSEARRELLCAIADEPPHFAARILGAAEPMFSASGWQAVCDLVAERLLERLCMDLEMTPIFLHDPRDEWENRVHRAATMCAFRPLLAGRAAYEAMVLVVGLLDGKGHGIDAQLKDYLQRFPALRDALYLGQVLHVIPGTGAKPLSGGAMRMIMDAIIDRIDTDVHIWWPHLPRVVSRLDRKQERRMRGKLTRMLRRKNLSTETRRSLIEVRAEFDEMRNTKRLCRSTGRIAGPPVAPAPSSEEAPRRPQRRAPSNRRQLPLELS